MPGEEVLYQAKGYKTKKDIVWLLSGFPNHIEELSKPLKLLKDDPKNPVLLCNVAIGYQNCAKTLSEKARDIFIKMSFSYFNSSKKYFKKKKDVTSIQRIDILKCYSDIIKGHPKSAIKELGKAEVENIQESNKALAYFIMVNGYMELEDITNANLYAEKLKLLAESSSYVEELSRAYPEIFR